MKQRPLICVDFDGVVHAYSSGWQGVDIVADPPVPGAFDWLAELLEAETGPLPVIYSSRSAAEGGIDAMRRWFTLHGFPPALLERLAFPSHKPPAFLTIDDRAICFEGAFPSAAEMLAFTPWNKRARAPP